MDELVRLRKLMNKNMRAGKLSLWTVYDHPRDFSKSYVARMYTVGDGGSEQATEEILIATTLETLRYILEYEFTLTCIQRDPNDDPKIVETWL